MNGSKSIIASTCLVFERYKWRSDQEEKLEELGFRKLFYLHPTRTRVNPDYVGDEIIYYQEDYLLWLDYINGQVRIFQFVEMDPYIEGFELIAQDSEWKLHVNRKQDFLILESKEGEGEKSVFKIAYKGDM